MKILFQLKILFVSQKEPFSIEEKEDHIIQHLLPSETIFDIKKMIATKKKFPIEELRASSIVYKYSCLNVVNENDIDEKKPLAHYNGYLIDTILIKEKTFSFNLQIVTQEGVSKKEKSPDSFKITVKSSQTILDIIQLVSVTYGIPVDKLFVSSIAFGGCHSTSVTKGIDKHKKVGEYDGNMIESITLQEDKDLFLNILISHEKDLFIHAEEKNLVDFGSKSSRTISELKKEISSKENIPIKFLKISSITYKKSSFNTVQGEIDEEQTLEYYNGAEIDRVHMEELTFTFTLSIITKKGIFRTERSEDSFEIRVKQSQTIGQILQKLFAVKNVPIEKLVVSSIVYRDSLPNICDEKLFANNKCLGSYDVDKIKEITVKEI